MWPDRRLLDLLGIELPIVQAPMAGATDAEMAIAVSESGGLGSLPWSGQAGGLARAGSASELTRKLVASALERLGVLAQTG